MKNLVIFITGPTGSGKTTVAKILTKKLGRCTNIDVDQVKHMIECGFLKKELPGGRTVWQYSEWGLVGESIALLSKNFIKQGFNVVINGYIGNDGWTSLTKKLSITHKFLLLPDIKVIKKRDVNRPEDLKMGIEMIKKHYDEFNSDSKFNDFIKIDSSEQTAEQTAREISAHIRN